MTGFTDPPIAVSSNPIAQKDAAETFGEPDVTVSGSNQIVADESVQIVAGLAEDFEDGDLTVDDPRSLWGQSGSGSLDTNSEMSGTNSLSLSASSGNINHYYQSNGGYPAAYLEMDLKKSGSTATAGDFVGLEVFGDDSSIVTVRMDEGSGEWTVNGTQTGTTFSAGTAYTVRVEIDWATDSGQVLLDGSGLASFSYGAANEALDNFAINCHTFDGGGNMTAFLDELDVPGASSATAYISWPVPSDIFRWDAATFTRTLDGEAVDVFIEADDGTGWSEVAGPIGRGDDIPAAPGDDVRFRVDIERTDAANNPTLDSIYRRYVL